MTDGVIHQPCQIRQVETRHKWQTRFGTRSRRANNGVGIDGYVVSACKRGLVWMTYNNRSSHWNGRNSHNGGRRANAPMHKGSYSMNHGTPLVGSVPAIVCVVARGPLGLGQMGSIEGIPDMRGGVATSPLSTVLPERGQQVHQPWGQMGL